MAWQSAPTTTANNANQNFAQDTGLMPGAYTAPPPVPIWETMQAAPSPLAIFQPAPVGYPIG